MPPTLRTPEIVEQCLSLITQGVTMSEACRTVGIDRRRWQTWVSGDPDLAREYRDARAIGADAIADDIIRIADDTKADTAEVAKSRLRTDVRLKLLAKWQPDLYGDKVDVRHQGPDGGAVQVAYASAADLARQMRAVLNGTAKDTPLLPGSDLL